jgi:hypothetical protein
MKYHNKIIVFGVINLPGFRADESVKSSPPFLFAHLPQMPVYDIVKGLFVP